MNNCYIWHVLISTGNLSCVFVTTTIPSLIRRRVDREIRIHSRLSHPNIVKLHTWFEDEHSIYLVLELLPKDLFRCERAV